MTQNPSSEASTPPQTNAADDLPTWARELITRTDAAVGSLNGRVSRMGQDLGAVRSKVKADAPAGAAEAPKEPPLTRDEVVAARRMGQLLSKLPDEAQKHFEEQEAAGVPYSAMLQQAELLARFAVPTPAPKESSAQRDAVAGPRGIGATPASTHVAGPASQAAARDMKATPEGAARLRAWMAAGGEVQKLPPF